MKRMLRNCLLFPIKNCKTLILKPALTFAALVFCFIQVSAQKPKPSAKTKNKPASEMKRCGTMEGIEEMKRLDPEFRAMMEQNERDFQNWLANPNNTSSQRPVSPAALPGPVTIPVVVHVVLPNPWIITDEAIDAFFARLNEDFAGINADSTNCSLGNFCGVRGHSLLRFARAKRDPRGNYTTGVVRVVGTTEITGGAQPIKNSNTITGGSTGWDVSKYYNIYVGDGGAAGLLGISPGIGPGSAVLGNGFQDGVCVDYRAFAGFCFSYDEYRLSRTTVHEIGHNFGLYHIWGDGNTCVAGADFRQLSSAGGCSLPTNLLGAADDTPFSSGAFQGCPGAAIGNGCTPAAPRMFQNYMDYTDDACYSMFTLGQAKRMEWVLEFCRSGYLNSNGADYTQLPVDAMINSVVSPGGAEVIGNTGDCDTAGAVYPRQTCPGPFVPKVRITNAGTTPISSFTVTASINNASFETRTFNLTIQPGRSRVVTMGLKDAVAGLNNLKFEISSPNGGLDGNPANDTLTYRFNTGTPLGLPFTENFSATAFPPANGSQIINPDADVTWERATTGRPAPGSMKMDFYNYSDVGQRDIFSLPPVVTEKYDSIRVSFYVAYQRYEDGGTPATNDSLVVVYSGDCGVTWQRSSFAKGGATLATAPNSDQDFTPGGNAQWRKETVILKDFCANGIKNMRIGFEAYNDFGNNLYVDSITLVGFTGLTTNAALERIADPLPAICDRSFTPRVIFSNQASDTLKSLTIRYVIDRSADTVTYNWTGAIARCDAGEAVLPSANVAFGTHIIEVFTSNPNGVTDQVTSNDQLIKRFTVISAEEMPVAEGFESNAFPPENWGVYDVNGGVTWDSSSVAARTGAGALLMNNPATSNPFNAVDYFISPIINNSSTLDSVFVDFDLSYKSGDNYPGSTILPLDTLEVLATTDCGLTFTSVWKKWGDNLQTVNDPNNTWTAPYVPRATEWRKQRAYLTPFVGSANFQLYFAMKGNKQNNLWVDNINISGQRLPQRLKDQGYLIYPNPFNGSFLVHHSAVEPPVDLQNIQVYNAAGQLVWSQDYNGNASRQITVDLNKAASGMYVLKLIYTNRTVVERIVKTQ